jgi:hypothetical protein
MKDYALILKDVLDRARIDEVPADVNGDSSPRFAWRMGFLTAVSTIMDAFDAAEAEEKESVQ